MRTDAPIQRLGRSGGSSAFTARSVSSGLLTLAAATFSDAAAPMVSAQSVTYQGLQVTLQGSAGATIDTLSATQGACWLWSLGGTINLTQRPSVLTVLERNCSVYPSLVSVVCGFVDNGDARSTTGNGWGVEIGWPSTTVRRVAYWARAGAGWARTVGAGVAGTHFGADCHVRPHTHTDIAQGRCYPRDGSGGRSSVPGANAQGSTAQLESRVTHFFTAILWNSVAGASPVITFDPSYWIGEVAMAA